MSFGKFGQNDEFEEWSRKIHDIMDEMQRRAYVHFRDSGCWQPATNIYETRTAYYICVELAGMTRDEIEIECRDCRIILLSGKRRQPRPEGVEGPLSIHAMEIDEGLFRREIDLPEDIEVDGIEATYCEGYLWITAPRMITE